MRLHIWSYIKYGVHSISYLVSEVHVGSTLDQHLDNPHTPPPSCSQEGRVLILYRVNTRTMFTCTAAATSQYNHHNQQLIAQLSSDLLPHLAGLGQHLPQSAVEQHPHVPGLPRGGEQYTHPAHECVVCVCVCVCVCSCVCVVCVCVCVCVCVLCVCVCVV